jgi:transcriptional regulator with XRE-family HTH domain
LEYLVAQGICSFADMSKTIYTPEYEELVSRLWLAREKTRLTQKQVAQRLGVTQSLISKMESGQYRIDVIQLAKLAKLYKKDISFFIK